MRVRLPKPLHGWRVFAGEVGVIVLGVIIALAAQQAAESVNERREAAATRSALTTEIEETLAVLSDPAAMSDIRESEASYGTGDAVRGSDAVRRLLRER